MFNRHLQKIVLGLWTLKAIHYIYVNKCPTTDFLVVDLKKTNHREIYVI